MSRRSRASIIIISLIAFGLRIHGLFFNSFHADESLFASWAREIAVWRDPLLLGQAVDKPPLLFYLQAMFYPIQGPVEWAARLPNFIASCAIVPLLAVLVWQLYQDQLASMFASLLAALSPLAIQFSGTAFTDPVLTTLLLSSMTTMAIGGRHRLKPVGSNESRFWRFAGICFGLAAAVKYQAWLFLPLIAAFGLFVGMDRRRWWQWLQGLLLVMIPLAVWTAARTSAAPLWSQQLANFGGVRLSYSWEIWPRLTSWMVLSNYLVSVPILLLSVLGFGIRNKVERLEKRWDRLLFAVVVGYMLLHWVAAIPVWDRYLLPVSPLVFVLSGRGLSQVYEYVRAAISADGLRHSGSSWGAIVLAAVLIIGMVPGALSAREGAFPIGGTPDADQGAAQVAAALADLPYGTVLYDHWFSWQWRYHLFDKRVYVSWFSNPEALVEQLQVFGRDGNTHFLALPGSDAGLPVIRAVAASGFGLELVPVDTSSSNEADGILLYRIVTED